MADAASASPKAVTVPRTGINQSATRVAAARSSNAPPIKAKDAGNGALSSSPELG